MISRTPQTPNPDVIKVLLVDDHPVVRVGIRTFLNNSGRVKVVGEAADGNEALSQALWQCPDVVFMDTFMPRMNGLVAAKSLCQEMRGIKVLMHSVHTGREYMLQIIRSGAVGYVPKDAPMSEILEAIERAHRGETYFNTEAARAACEEHQRDAQLHSHEMNSSLSCRELEVLSKIAEGGSTREIAAQMGIGVRTVETHRERIMDKLQIRSVAGLTRFAILCGIATIDSNPRKTETEASNLAVQSA